MSTRRKRNPSPVKPSKRAKTERNNEEVIDLTSDGPRPQDDEDLSDIMLQIDAMEKQAESSSMPAESDEALARRLAAEWDAEENEVGTSSSSRLTLGTRDNDDEILARQLAAEWDKEDPPLSNSTLRDTAVEGTSSVELRKFERLFTGTRPCSKCAKDVVSSRGFVLFTSSDLDTFPPTVTSLLHASCRACKTNHCRGCFTPLKCASSCKGVSKNANCTVHLCCPEIRAVALFETLASFDKVYLAEKANSSKRVKTAKQTSKTVSSVGPGGTGYSQDSRGDHHAHARGGSRGHTDERKSKGKGQTTDNESQWDKTVVTMLHLITKLLPEPYAEIPQTFDLLPHTSIGQLLIMSQLTDLLAGLLRNDSISDWTARSTTYHAMLTLLRRMGDCELTIRVLLEPRKERSYTPGLESWMWGEEEMTWVTSKKGDVEMAPPLYDYFKKLTTQSRAFISGAANVVEGDEDVLDSIACGSSLCGDIIAANEDMERAISLLGISSDASLQDSSSTGKGKGKGRDATVEMEKKYSQACERLAFKYVELRDTDKVAASASRHKPHANFKYASAARQSENGTRNPKDRVHLIREEAVMSTSLPPGIWVRIDEVRNDILKIMIAGPEGTPYANGLFEFDCFMPLQYPQVPPQVHLCTTGGGTVGFNPNLYADGKVCLSLLGTWAGRPEEQWQPYKSTLLQVLVSIQSMILIDLPYFNEPGRGAAKKTSASTTYNRGLTLQTTRWAIVDWLKEEHRRGIWADVIASHFKIRQDVIRKTIVQWGRENPDIHRYHHGQRVPDHWGVCPPANSVPHTGGMDLLKEFDRGMALIQKWTSRE